MRLGVLDPARDGGDMNAKTPEDLSRLFVERANAGDAAGLAALYEPDAVLAYPPGGTTVGRAAIQAVCEEMLRHVPRFEVEEALPTIHHGARALPATKRKAGRGGRVQVAPPQPDGTWLRV